MLLRSTELTHTSEKFDFTTKEFGTGKEIRSQELQPGAAVANQLSVHSSLKVIGWRHTVEYGSLKLASILSVILGNP